MSVLAGGAGTRHALKDGDTFLVCDQAGDLTGDADGLYREGTRVLSCLRLRLGDATASLLSSSVSQDNVFLNVHLTNRPLVPLGGPAASEGVIHIERTRFLWDARMYERIVMTNYGQTPMELLLRLEYEADFRDMFEVRGARRSGRGVQEPARLQAHGVRLCYRGLDGLERALSLDFSLPSRHLDGEGAEFVLSLPAGGQQDFYLEAGQTPAEPQRARFRSAAAAARRAMRKRRRAGASIRSASGPFNAWLERSRADIALLVSDLPTGPYPYAGIPWFSTPFGRDAIVTAMQTLWLDPSLARGVLAFLAHSQSRETSTFRDAEPGKILHETRKGEMVALRELPFERYYGGVDTTPLFLMLAGQYARRTGEMGFIDELWPALREATAWVERSCDHDLHGLLAYARGEAGGLENQGWKDSHDSVFHADGSTPSGPIALVEVQGYACAALWEMARLAQRRGQGELAAHWRQRAHALQSRIEELFWDQEMGFYGLALDGHGQLCRVRASNAGHLLYAGVPTPERARLVATQLLGKAFDQGWGVRTLASDQARYNPMSYHNGSIWPHDVALCAAGMARYGLRQAAARLLMETFEAAIHFGMRLPELFCGFGRSPGEPPTAYPVACLPQAWSAGSVFMLLQACLGLRVEAERGQVVIEQPQLPQGVQHLIVQRLPVGTAHVDVLFERIGERVVADRLGGDEGIQVVAHL